MDLRHDEKEGPAFAFFWRVFFGVCGSVGQHSLLIVFRDEGFYFFQRPAATSTGLVDLSRFGYKDVLYVGVPRYLTGGMGPVGFFSPVEDLCPCVHVINCYWGQAAEDTCTTG